MKIVILAVGKAKTEYYEAAIAAYSKRLSKWVKASWQFIPASNKDHESAALLGTLPAASRVILLDEQGQACSTVQFAETIESLQNQSIKVVVFIIGGAYGVNSAIRQRAHHVIKLSDLIFPHELVRLILVEQLYRAYDINHGGNYHHT